MEVPYRNSVADSEGQRSSIFVPSGSPQTVNEPASPVKTGTFAATVSTLINRSRPQSQRRRDYDEMQETTRRQSVRRMTISVQEPTSTDDDKDYRVTVL